MKRFRFGVRRVGAAIANYVKNTYILLWITVLCASVFSCILVFSATHSLGMRQTITQIIACVIGYTGAVILSTMDYEQLGELWWLVGGVCVLLVAATFVFGVKATELADDRAWLNIFGVSFQPSELMKIGFIITFAFHLSKTVQHGHINSIPHVLALLGHGIFPVALIMIQGDTGTALVFAFVFAIMLFSSGLDWKFIAVGVVALLASLPLVWQILPSFQKERIRVVYNPQEGDESDQLYQQTLGRLALGSGKVSGQGWLSGRMVQSGIIPEDQNDFIFTVAGEEFGFIGTALVLIILFLIMALTIRAAFVARDYMGRFICIGFFAIVAIQTVFNVGMCLVVLPVIGITLPFFSAGGSSSMCLYFGFGLVLSVYMRRKDTSLRLS